MKTSVRLTFRRLLGAGMLLGCLALVVGLFLVKRQVTPEAALASWERDMFTFELGMIRFWVALFVLIILLYFFLEWKTAQRASTEPPRISLQSSAGPATDAVSSLSKRPRVMLPRKVGVGIMLFWPILAAALLGLKNELSISPTGFASAITSYLTILAAIAGAQFMIHLFYMLLGKRAENSPQPALNATA